jgi:uncharacterized protein YaeQ
MSLKATIYKIDLQIADMDRGYYATHKLTLAQHPSETALRLMVRVIAFALNAHEQLTFGRGLSTEDEPDLWRRDLTGRIEQWIDLGQPDESRIRRACGRADQVLLYTYGGRSTQIWWDKMSTTLARNKNLRVIDLAEEGCALLAALLARTLSLQCMIQDGNVQFLTDQASVSLDPRHLLGDVN